MKSQLITVFTGSRLLTKHFDCLFIILMIWFLQPNSKQDKQVSLSKLLTIEHIDNEKKNPGFLVGEWAKNRITTHPLSI